MKLKKNNFIARLFKKNKLRPKIYPAKSLKLKRNNFGAAVLSVVETLQAHGYQAYIVGGGVRDHLLGLTAKDYDVATNAHPEQIKKCFQRCLIIGKRFRLAHVYVNRKDYIEVATFRAGHEQAKHKDEARVKQGGIIARDNVYGTMEEDALRRDFTVNALYYDPVQDLVFDFSDGLLDLQHKTLRLLGTPEQRLTEDPVRILRGLRIAGKLNLEIEANLLATIPKYLPLLAEMSNGRLFDEYTKLFLHGAGLNNFLSLQAFKIFPYLFPQTALCLPEAWFFSMVEFALKNTDERFLLGKTIHPAFLIAVFLYAPLLLQTKKLLKSMTKKQAFVHAVDEVLKQQVKTTSMPNYFSQMVRDVWSLQRALELKRKSKILDILQHPRFRAAYDFLLLRVQAKEANANTAAFWTEIQSLDDALVLERIAALKK